MKIIVFGCQQIAVEFIRFLQKRNDVELSLILTYELPLDKTYGYESVFETFQDSGIPLLNVKTISAQIVEHIEIIQPDFIFSIYYRKILPERILKIAPNRCINIHPGLLPYYRGPIPTAWAIQNGEKEFGITIHLMDNNIDTGNILIQKKYDIIENETGFALYTRAMKIGFELLVSSFNDIINNRIKPVVQSGPGSYYGKKNGKYLIDWQQDAEKINNIIRVHAKPFNPAESLLFNRYILINKAKIIRDSKYPAQGPGIIVDVLENDKIVISCAEGCLVLEEYEIVPYLDKSEKPIYLQIGNRLG